MNARPVRRTAIALTAAALFALTACSGGGDDSSGGGDSGGVASGQDVADMVGCTDFTNDSEELFVTEGGRCTLDGEQISVYYFADNDARDNYVDAGSDFGGNYLVGDQWVVDAPSAVLDAIQKEHGGERP